MKTSESIGALGPNLFGDQTDPYSGSTDFWVTDISLPGNNDLSVALIRKFEGSDDGLGGYLQWSNFEVPYLSGIFPWGSASRNLNGWNSWVNGSYEKRCSMVTPPPEVRQSSGKEDTFMAEEYFHGIRLNLPGGNAQLLLTGAADVPADGQTYRWATNEDWRFSCISQLKNGAPGEGFLARDPRGNKYYFDWLVPGEITDHIRKIGLLGETLLGRREQRLYVTRIEDRFGNWVNYVYQNANLATVTSSDGRSLTLTYDATATRLVSATDGRRNWLYEYPANEVKLTYPDGATWSSSLSGEIRRVGVGCSGTQAPERYTGAATLTLRHPSGAVGKFSFSNLRRGLSYVKWVEVAGSSWCNQDPKDYDNIALKLKSIQGPGITALDWSFVYGPANSCYINQNRGQECTATSPTTRTVEIQGPAGTFVRYEYGNKAYENDGILLKTEWGGAGTVFKTEIQNWQVFDGVGLPLNGAGNHFWEQRRRRLKNVETFQDNVIFHRDINEFDSSLRPVNVSLWNTLGYRKTDVLAYFDSSSKWILGQIASETNQDTGATPSRIEYAPDSAMPVSFYQFGKLQKTMAYHPDGNIASVTDGRNLVTAFNDWKRGVPQTVRFHDGTQKISVVDDNGWVTSVVDESGNTIGYDYDQMGRLSHVTYPAGDDTVWNDTRSQFDQANVNEFGLSGGHWRQVMTTGNSKKTIFFDALWRPVVEQEEDVSNPAATTRWTMKCYDHEGRITFSSYPRNPFVDGARNFDCTGIIP
ncbi:MULTISPECIES: RHS repeat domain-containing protein [Lysobacter]|uniref:RHS repeat domain-containing protein n=1 Tax=Lysobacter TaxID=68 RepID=UPI001F3E5942|nr:MULTISPECIES: RHS repeat domain-containing protein [Lysobacter]UJB20166.1 RHS repeat protein [Lysobacter capsici]UJQ30719.1 RHS repeat protein [Lysobacter gummosus]